MNQTPPRAPHAHDDVPGALAGVTGIVIDCADTDLTVEADDALFDRVHLVATNGRDAPLLLQEGNQLVITQNGRHRGSGTPTLRVPAAACPPITGEHQKGQLRISGVRGAIDLRHGTGDVTIRQLQADLTLNMDRGDLTLVEMTGQAHLACGSGDVRIVQLHGLLHVAVGRGDVQIDSSSGDFDVNLGSGDVTLDACTGGMQLRIGSGDTRIVSPFDAAINLRGGSGDATIHGGSARSINIKQGRGDISSSARLLPDDATVTDEQDVPPQGMRIDDDGVRFTSRNLRFEATSAGVRIQKSGTSIEADDRGVRIVRGQRDGAGQYELETAKGDINVSIPADTAVRVEAIVQGGDVQSDVPLVSVGRPGPRGATQRFVGVSDAQATQRINVKMKTDRGDIRVRAVTMPSRAQRAEQPTTRLTDLPIETFVSPTWPATGMPMPAPASATPADDMGSATDMRAVLEALASGSISVEEADRRLRDLSDLSDLSDQA